MKIQKLEEYLDLFPPGFIDPFYPRRIICPNGYVDPKYFSLACALSCHELARKEPSQMHGVTTLTINALLNYNMPTYFLDSQFLMACNATDPPKDYPISDILWPLPAMLFVLPSSFVMSHLGFNTPFLSTARLGSGPAKFHHSITSREYVGSQGPMLSTYTPMLLSDGNIISYAGWFPETYNIGVLDSEKNVFQSDEETLKAFLRERNAPPDVIEKFFNHSDSPKSEYEDKLLLRRIEMLTVKILLTIGAVPNLIYNGSQERKQKIKHGVIVRDALWSPNFIGRGYKLKHDHQPGDGTHASPKFHWRRGHWHNVVHGKGRSLRKLQWFEPTLVNAPE